MSIYSLTEYTGKRRNRDRMMVIATFEVKRHTLIVTGLSIAAVLPLSILLLFTPLQQLGFFIPIALAIPVGQFLFIGYQRRGLQVSRFRRIMNSRQFRKGVFLINGAPFEKPRIVLHRPVTITQAHRPNLSNAKHSKHFTQSTPDPASLQPVVPGKKSRR